MPPAAASDLGIAGPLLGGGLLLLVVVVIVRLQALQLLCGDLWLRSPACPAFIGPPSPLACPLSVDLLRFPAPPICLPSLLGLAIAAYKNTVYLIF